MGKNMNVIGMHYIKKKQQSHGNTCESCKKCKCQNKSIMSPKKKNSHVNTKESVRKNHVTINVTRKYVHCVKMTQIMLFILNFHITLFTDDILNVPNDFNI